ncbi:neurotrypsin-like [Lytechinus variegatus]|uniref:neurotrypsin-like n=1 Tax=Lytechinus variegatus TaxID=7654 RepID=UPI001BB20BB9|nr:neurotrypsin-like [Lytechinus variegatus]
MDGTLNILMHLFTYGVWCTLLGRRAFGAMSEINLLSGSSSFEGVVQYRYDGMTGLICDQDWGDLDAEVVCRQLGYQQGLSLKPVSLGPISGYMWNRDFDCDGTEDCLENCTFTDGGTSIYPPCPPDEIAQVSCGPPHDFDIRMAGSNFTEQGRLEVHLDGEWGSVADRGSFDEETLGVVCRVLGYQDGSSFRTNPAGFGRGDGPILIDDLQCDMYTGGFIFSSLTTNISQCNVMLTNDTSNTTAQMHQNDIGVVCYPYESVANHPVRLIDEEGEINPDYGRVEIYHDGEWRSVCLEDYQRFYYQICLELDPGWDFIGDTIDLTSYNLSTSSTQAWFELHSCSGVERLYKCDHSGWGQLGQCPVQNVAGLSCIRILTTIVPPTYQPPPGPEAWIFVVVSFAIITILFFVVLCIWRLYKGIQAQMNSTSVRSQPTVNMVEVGTVYPSASNPDSTVADPAPNYNNDLPPSYESVVSGSHAQVMSKDTETGDLGGDNGQD